MGDLDSMKEELQALRARLDRLERELNIARKLIAEHGQALRVTTSNKSTDDD